MIHRLLACFLFVLIAAVAATGGAAVAVAADDGYTATKPAKVDPIYGGWPRTIFAFPGKDCPPGSHAYTGPEEAEIAKLNYTYCLFGRHYVYFFKSATLNRCPDGKDPVVTAKVVNHQQKTVDIMWCAMPDARFFRNGIMVPPSLPRTAAPNTDTGKPPQAKSPAAAVKAGQEDAAPPNFLKGESVKPPKAAPAPQPTIDLPKPIAPEPMENLPKPPPPLKVKTPVGTSTTPPGGDDDN